MTSESFPEGPASADVHMRIAALWVYPVKSCAGVRVQASTLTDKGLAWDRAWMVVDAEGEMLTQREWPAMAHIQPQLDDTHLCLDAPGRARLTLPLAPSPSAGVRRVRVWDDEVPALDAGGAASDWFTQHLRETQPALAAQCPLPLRLVRFDERIVRPSSPRWTRGHTALNRFGDGFAVLVVSHASLDELNRRLQQSGERTVDLRRFRPNVVLDGPDLMAHDEDRLGALCIDTAPEGEAAAAVLLPVKPCPRCPIPDINPDHADDPTRERAVVTTALRAYRSDARVGGALTFGMNALVLRGSGQTLREGQAVWADWAFGG